MMATIFSVVVAGMFFGVEGVFPGALGHVLFSNYIFQGIFCLFLFLALSPFILISFFLGKGAKNPIVSASVRACFCDTNLYLLSAFVFAVSIVGLVVSSQNFFYDPYVFAFSIFLLGLSFDATRLCFLRIGKCFSQDSLANWIALKIRKAIRHVDERGVFESFELIFSLLASYIKHEDMSSLRLFSRRVIGLVEELLRAVSTIPIFGKIQNDSLLDRYSMAESLTTKRLAWTMKAADKEGSPTAIEETMRLYGKLFMVFHNHHESLGFLLLVSLSHDVLVTEGSPEKNAEVMMICSEVIKSLIDRSYERRVSEKTSIVKILTLLETHVKTCFRKDRSINPAFLMQPFAEIGQLMGDPLYASLPERDEILMELKRILTQFAALEMVSTHVDTGEQGTDTKSSYREDLPFQARP